MATLFIFAEPSETTAPLEDKPWVCCLFETDGLTAPKLSNLDKSQVKELSLRAKIILVLPTQQTSLFRLPLPKLDAHKARQAIPFALEEQLAESLTKIHFAFNRQFYTEGAYLILVIRALYIQAKIQQWREADITLDAITLDWFALADNAACISPWGLLINEPDFQGALTGELATHYLRMHPTLRTTVCSNSNATWKPLETEPMDEPFELWASKALLTAPYIDLCQGILSEEKHRKPLQRWGNILLILSIFWSALFIFSHLGALLILHQQKNKIDTEIAAIYRHFFPHAKQIISPRFRINQLFNSGASSDETAHLWRLLTALDKAYQPKSAVHIDNIRYADSHLTLSLTAIDFSALEQLREKLEKNGLVVHQDQATSHEKGVSASMELTIK
jgi:general secretion pathway protein L